MVAPHFRNYNIFCLNILVTSSANFDGMLTCSVDESSTYTRVARRSRPKSAKMKEATVEVGLARIVGNQRFCCVRESYDDVIHRAQFDVPEIFGIAHGYRRSDMWPIYRADNASMTSMGNHGSTMLATA